MIETTAQSAILAHLRQHLPTLLGVYAFGSQVQGTATVGSEKMYLNEARAGLLADIARDGRIYGKNPNQDR